MNDNERCRPRLDAVALQAIFDKARDAIVLMDDEARYVDANPAACELFGTPRDELVRRDLFHFASPDRRELTLQRWQAFRRGDIDGGEFMLQRPDGGQRMLEHRSVRDVMPGLHLSILRDVTRRANVLAETGLDKEFITLGQSFVAELDLDRLVQAVIDAATRMCGAAFGALFYKPQEDGGDTYMLYALSGAPREAFAHFPMLRPTAVFAPTFEGTGIVRSDDITKDPRYGRNTPFRGMPPGHLPVRSYLGVPVITRTGEVIGGLFLGHPAPGVFDDRSEQLLRGVAGHTAVALDNARLYTRTRTALDALREADERKDEFLAMLSHELRNPLSPLVNALRLLGRSDALTDADRRALAMAERQTRQLTRLVDDLLEVSRITRGKIELRCEAMPVDAAVRGAVESVRAQLEQRRQHVELALPQASSDIVADPARVAQILENLLNNASKYTPEGGLIRVELENRADEVEIRVIDNGVGIEPEKLPHLFEMFNQVDATLDRSQGGLGIGLAMVQRLVALHGGRVTATSEGIGKGAAFGVTLPRMPQPQF